MLRRVLARMSPEAAASVELRTLLEDLEGVATRCSEALHATCVRCDTFLANAPHLRLVDNQVVVVDDATAASHEAPAM